MITDTPTRYGSISRLLHGLTAVLVLIQFTRFFDDAVDKSHWVNSVIKPLHGSLGFVLFVVIIIRIIWMISQHNHRPIPHQFAKLAKAGHHLLYFLVVLMPITGMCYVLGKGYDIKVFDTLVIPNNGPSENLSAIGQLHAPIAWLLLIVVLGHIAAALYHHFGAKDDTLKRMF
jgi:cytochrome b561